MTHRGIDFRVLGPVEAWSGGSEVRLTAQKHRAVLAVGLLSANHVVPVTRLIDAVWADDPPATATSVIQNYIYEVRRALRRYGAGPLIQTRPPGYIFTIGAAELDLSRFEALIADSRLAMAGGQDRRALAALRSALALWRGPALADMDGRLLRNEAVRMEAMRLSAVEERIDVELRLGPPDAVVPELVSLVAAHPLRERFRSQLMLALYRVGRAADALEVYRQGRAALRDELGLDPSPALRQLEARILAGAPDLSVVDTEVRIDGVAQRPVPNQLPAAQSALVGREGFVATLSAALDPSTPPARPVVTAVSGGAGTGTTALALLVADRVRETYPDGQLYSSFAGTGRARAAPGEQIVAGLLRALHGQTTAVPELYSEACALLRDELSRRRVLVVLDDVEFEAQVRELMPATGGSAFLVVSRAPLTLLEPAATVDLDPLAAPEALTLLAQLAGQNRVWSEPLAAQAIVGYCEGLPLALRVAGARLAARPDWPLSVLAARLSDPHRRLSELVAGALSLRHSLDRAFRRLDRAHRLALRAFASSTQPSMSAPLLATLIGAEIPEAERITDSLVGHRLLDQLRVDAHGQIWYRLHGLNRLYVAERTGVRAASAGPESGWSGAGAGHSTVLAKRR